MSTEALMSQEAEEQEIEVDVTELSDDQLSEELEGPKDEIVEEDETEDEPEETEEKEAEGEKEPETEQPKSLEEVRLELEETKAQLEKQQKVQETNQTFIQRQANELGELRKLKDQLLKRREELRQADVAQQLVADPNALRNGLAEDADISRRLESVEQQEADVQLQHEMQINRNTVINLFPDIETAENLEAICQVAIESGESPENVAAYKAAPYRMHPAITARYYDLVQQKRILSEKDSRISELEKQIETLKTRPRSLLEKIETTAKTVPVKGKATGGKATSDMGELTEQQIADLSTEDLNRLLKEMEK